MSNYYSIAILANCLPIFIFKCRISLHTSMLSPNPEYLPARILSVNFSFGTILFLRLAGAILKSRAVPIFIIIISALRIFSMHKMLQTTLSRFDADT